MGLSGTADDQNSNKAFAEKFGFTYPLLDGTGLKLPQAMGVDGARWCVLVGTDGKIEKLWPAVDAKTAAETILAEA